MEKQNIVIDQQTNFFDYKVGFPINMKQEKNAIY